MKPEHVSQWMDLPGWNIRQLTQHGVGELLKVNGLGWGIHKKSKVKSKK
jgi:hypothetical protein